MARNLVLESAGFRTSRTDRFSVLASFTNLKHLQVDVLDQQELEDVLKAVCKMKHLNSLVLTTRHGGFGPAEITTESLECLKALHSLEKLEF